MSEWIIDATGSPQPDELERLLVSDLRAIHRAPVPPLEFEEPVPTSRVPAGLWRPAAVAAALALGALAFLLDPFGPDRQPVTTVNAAELIAQSNEVMASMGAAQAQGAFHFVATSGGGGSFWTTETWYGGPGKFRSESRAGNLLVGVVADGPEGWAFLQEDGKAPNVVRGPLSEISLFSEEASTQLMSLSDVLASYAEPGCQTATSLPDAVVAGRLAHVVRISPATAGCTIPRPHLGSGATIWVDQETLVTLRVESESYHYEVTSFEASASIPPETFVYTPPADVPVTEAQNEDQAKMGLSGSEPR